MRKSFKFKLFTNKKKAKRLRQELFIFCSIYNHCLRLIKNHYKIFKKNPTKNDLQKHLVRLMKRGDQPEWKNLSYSQGIQDVTDRIYKSYDSFFNWCKKKSGDRKSPPKFRPFRKYKSFTLKQAGWSLDKEKGRVKIGKRYYRYNKSRSIIGVAKTITIKRDAVGDFYIIISCDLGEGFIPTKVASMTGKSAGFDFGLKSFLKSSENEEIGSGEFLKSSLLELKKKGQELSKKVKGSKNRKKARKALARVYRKISNQREDAHFKLAHILVHQYDLLVFENLSMNGMKKLWGRKISDYAFADFLKILKFKCAEHRKQFIKVDKFFPSSKLCSNLQCGNIKLKEELKLSDRVYCCDGCGLVIDRDLNAAINILREGISSLGLDRVRRKEISALVA